MIFDDHHAAVLRDLLAWRRDVRHFRTDPVAPALLEEMAAAMDLAPSVGASQPWRVLELRAPELRAAIVDNHRKANDAAAAAYEGAERRHYRSLKLAGLIEAPVQLAVFTDMAPSAGKGLGRQTMPETLLYSTILAIHHLWLTARSRNLGVGWVSILDPDAIADLLEVEKSWRFTAYLCIGHPAQHDDRPELERRGWQARRPTAWRVR